MPCELTQDSYLTGPEPRLKCSCGWYPMCRLKTETIYDYFDRVKAEHRKHVAEGTIVDPKYFGPQKVHCSFMSYAPGENTGVVEFELDSDKTVLFIYRVDLKTFHGFAVGKGYSVNIVSDTEFGWWHPPVIDPPTPSGGGDSARGVR